MNHDDFAANEQLAHSELAAVLRQLDKGTLDLTRAIRVPSQDRGKDTTSVTFRYPLYIDAAINEQCGRGLKFASRSDFIRHYCIIGLAVEKQMADVPVRDAVIVKAAHDDEMEKLAAIDTLIGGFASELKNADGDPHRQKILARAQVVRDICEAEGYLERMWTIDRAIADGTR